MTIYDDALASIAPKYDSDLFLGRLCWYAVSDALKVTHAEFHKVAFTNFFGLNEQPQFPGLPKPTDVFKRACTQAQVKNVPANIEGQDMKYNYMVRPSGHDADYIWRTIVREKLDSAGHTLNYDELVKVTFHRKTEKLRFNNVTEEDDTTVNAIAQNIASYYHNEAENITAYAVREFARNTLEKLFKSVRVRPSGGVYFVAEEHAAALEALDKTMNTLGEGASFHYLPLLDDSKQREMLRAAFEEESVGEVDRLISEMAEIIKLDQKISTDRFANFKVEYDGLRNKTKDYSALLGEKMFSTDNRLEIMEQVLVELISHVKL